MYCAEFLARQSLIDQKGMSVGLAGFVSHLHYHEPYNLALVHLLQVKMPMTGYLLKSPPCIHSYSVIRVSSSKGPLVKILAKIEVSINT